jgi:hypothetical protein
MQQLLSHDLGFGRLGQDSKQAHDSDRKLLRSITKVLGMTHLPNYQLTQFPNAA